MSPRVNKLERILPAVQYIEHHYNTEISYTELAQLLNVSKYHFCHLFKEATGKTVVQYINDVRLDKAYHLLKNTDMNITQISMSVGFNDMNYFSRLFRKYKNVPPSKVRVRKNALCNMSMKEKAQEFILCFYYSYLSTRYPAPSLHQQSLRSRRCSHPQHNCSAYRTPSAAEEAALKISFIIL